MQIAVRPALSLRAAAAAMAMVLAPMCPGGLALAQSTLIAQAGPGIVTDAAAWPRWQGRLGIATPSDTAQERFDRSASPARFSLFGDYYFLQQGAAEHGRYGGGFRATGGLLVGPRGLAWSAPADSAAALGTGFSAQRRSFSLLSSLPMVDGGESTSASVPYLGVGYTGLKSLKATGGGWGFSADVGVMALQPRSAVQLGQQGSSELMKDLQLSPMLQLGVSYSF